MLREHGEPLLTWLEMSKSRLLLKEQPLSDQTLKWRASQQGHMTVVCLACTNNPYFRNVGHINEAYIPAAFSLH